MTQLKMTVQNDSSKWHSSIDTAQNDTIQNDTIQNDTIQNDTIQNDTIQNDTIQNDTVQNDTIQNDTVQNDSEQETEYILLFCPMPKFTYSFAERHSAEWHSAKQYVNCDVGHYLFSSESFSGLYYKTVMIVTYNRKWQLLVTPQFGASLMVVTDNIS